MEEEKELQNEDTELINRIKEESEKRINKILDEKITTSNIDFLSKLVDIHKDMSNEEYWKVKKEGIEMRYRTYDDYDNESYGRRGVRGTGPYSRYREGNSYGRRGVPGSGRGRYRGHDYIDEMHERYGNYAEANEDHRRGNYGAKDEMLESIDDTMGAVYDLVCVISEDATPEVMNIIRKHIKKMSEI